MKIMKLPSKWKNLNILEKITLITVFSITVFQIISVFVWVSPQTSDSKRYLLQAMQTAERNSFYPDKTNVITDYIVAPGYINYLSLFFRITNDIRVPMIFNVFLTLFFGFLVYYIAGKLFSSRNVGCVAVIFMYLLVTNSSEVLSFRTETLYNVLTYAAVAVVLSNIKGKFFIAGALFAMANSVRPLAITFLGAILLFLFVKKIKIRHMVKMTAMFLCTVVLIGTAGYISCGKFVYASTTGGINLIMSANDAADGSYDETVFQKGNPGYLSKEQKSGMTFKDRNDFYMEQSVKWILENPLSYIKQIPNKLFIMYGSENYSVTAYNSFSERPISQILKNLVSLNFDRLLFLDYMIIANQLLYIILLLFAVLGTVTVIRRKENRSSLFLLSMIMVTGTAMTLVTNMSPRYHNPYLPVLYILSAVFVCELRDKRNQKRTAI